MQKVSGQAPGTFAWGADSRIFHPQQVYGSGAAGESADIRESTWFPTINYPRYFAISNEARNTYTKYMDELTIGDKTYISSKRAAKITGYAKDYVGQLCREGRVEARLVGRNWYVLETSIREHRFGSAPSESKVEKVTPVMVGEEGPQKEKEWVPAVYESETPVMVPSLEPRVAMPASESQEVISEMQSAWQDWFSIRDAASTTAMLPNGTDDFKPEDLPVIIEEDEPVAINRIAETYVEEATEQSYMESVEEPLEIHRSYVEEGQREGFPEHMTVMDLSSERTYEAPANSVAKRKVQQTGTLATGLLRVVFVCLAISAACIALIGTGVIERITGVGTDGSGISTYLGGEWEYKSIK